MAAPPPYHMTPDELRRHGRSVIDWVADYLSRVETLPVAPRVAPGDVRAALPSSPPTGPEPFEAMLADVDRVILPGVLHWQSPSFFGYFPANSSGPSVLGELLSAGLAVQGMMWSTGPACTELESHVLDWMVELLGLPARFSSSGPGGGVIEDSASSATLCALLAARERAGGAAVLPRLRAYASTEAHSSVVKAARVAGLAAEQLRLVETDSGLVMDPARLRAKVAEDLAADAVPFFCVATAGTTSTLAFDPVGAIAEVCSEYGIWLHVDAAMAGSAAVCPELRFVNDGLDAADSYCVNPHKWLFTNFDCDCFYVADRRWLIEALSVTPEYLRNPASESGAVVDYRDWQIPLGRRFRALKLWFVLRYYGAEGLRHHIREHVRLAGGLAERVRAHPLLELAFPPALNLVCFRHRSGDERGERLLAELNATGRLFLSHTRVDGRYALRMAIGQTATEQRHVDEAWALIDELALAT